MTETKWETSKEKLSHDVDSDCAKSILAHWSSILETKKRLPRRSEIDALTFMKYTPHIWLTDKIEESRYKFRLAGEHVIEHFGMNPTGLEMKEIFKEPMLSHTIQFQDIITSASPAIVLHKGYRHMPSNPYPIQYERISIPLGDDNDRISHILGSSFFYGMSKTESILFKSKNELTHEEYYPIY